MISFIFKAFAVTFRAESGKKLNAPNEMLLLNSRCGTRAAHVAVSGLSSSWKTVLCECTIFHPMRIEFHALILHRLKSSKNKKTRKEVYFLPHV